MHKKSTFILSAVLFLSCFTVYAQQTPLQKQAIILKRVIEKNHYSPRPVNDSFSAQVFDRMIKKLDPYKLYFTAQDIAALGIYRNKIDDELIGKGWGFTDAFAKLYKARLLRSDSIRNRLLDKPFTFAAQEFFSYADNQQPPQDDAEHQLRISRYTKWQVLSKLIDDSVDDSIPLAKENLLKEEPAVRKKLKERSAKKMAGFTKEKEAFNTAIATLYLQTIASNFDPHTEYFPADEKEEFEEQLSSQSMEYGFDLEEDEDGDIKIGGLVPGGAAWKSGNVHNDDILLQIKPEGESAINVKDASTEEISALLAKHSSKKIEVTVKSADGTVKTIALQKEQQRNEDNIVHGIVLKGTKKIGYISLPSFYTDWGEEKGSSCANDVAKEIVKLKKENIDGLIFDLRYNGGGSLQEAVELAGIFIDIGPMSLVRGSDAKTFIYKDPNRGTIYDGPMVVMINGQSASASELLAGTLQDYKRAVVVGSNSFGKATMQSILPLDSTLKLDATYNPKNAPKDLGFVKLTLGKLFRVTCKTAQLNGVVPDVYLQDAFEAMEYTERSLPFALPSDTVMKTVVYTPLKATPTAQLQLQSSQRTGGDVFFTDLKKMIVLLKQIRQENKVPLQWEAYTKWIKSFDIHDEPVKTAAGKNKVFTIENSGFDNAMMKLDDYQKELNEYVLEDLADDPYIEEAFHVMMDMIDLKK
ncbi:MAG: carboxy terminal-processing peptidase [Bacteroidota bacterium]